MSDRRIHARGADGSEIVRYDKAGKWYWEKEGTRRTPLSILEAVRASRLSGMTVYLGLPGGSRFDHLYRQWRGAADGEM